VEPNILTSAKGIADGFPLSCFIARPDVADAFNPGDHLSTFGGNPVSAAAALTNIEVFKEEILVAASAKKGEYTVGLLKEIQEGISSIGDVRRKGLMIGVDIVADKDKKTPDATLVVKTQDTLREALFLISLGGTYENVFRIQPPLITAESDLKDSVDALKSALS